MRGLATRVILLLGLVSGVLPGVLLAMPAASQEQPPVSQQLRDALALADNCLYLLDSNAGRDPLDCQALLRWHAEQWPVLQQRLAGDTGALHLSQRDLANRQAYEQTVVLIRQWFERKSGS